MFRSPSLKLKLLAAAVLAAAPFVPTQAADCSASVLNHEQKRLLGGTENLCQQYAGKVVLVVNTASRCGYTPQFEGLEKLYRTHKDAGLVVLGFPSDQFRQEEASDAEVAKFCTANYGVSFPMFTKSMLKGKDANPFYVALTQATGEAPGWNFNKYLIGRDGRVISHFGSNVTPESPKLAKAIDAALAQPVAAAETTSEHAAR